MLIATKTIRLELMLIATKTISLELMLLAPVSLCSWILKQEIEHEHALHNDVCYDLKMMY
jgi:hypothetical protein